MLNREQSDEECDTTDDNSSIAADQKIIPFLPPITKCYQSSGTCCSPGIEFCKLATL